MRRRRYQKPRIINVGGYWIAQFRDLAGTKRKVSLGPIEKTRKHEAEQKLAQILEPINSRIEEPARDWTFGQFVRQVFFPFYKRKWKDSTFDTNKDRFDNHLIAMFGERTLGSFNRDDLQSFLEQKTARGLSYSVVAHLRWDLRQIFKMAVSEGAVSRNPAELLFVPREAPRPMKTSMTLDQVRLFFSVVDVRERIIGGFAVIAGMRPGEIFALKRASLEKGYADIQQRVYRGQMDTPKTLKSRRWAAFGDGLGMWIEQWLSMLPGRSSEAWVFPSDVITTPLSKDNCWRRNFLPRLKPVGLGWANFQVMRRTHSCLMDDIGVDPQVRADQLGHSVDVEQNEYTRASLDRRKGAINEFEKALGMM